MRHVNDRAYSPVIAVILLISITFVLASLVVLLMPQLPHLPADSVPVIFEITKMDYTKVPNSWKYENYMVVKNTGIKSYDNRKLSAKTYRNGILLPCIIPFINFKKYIDNKPLGIQTIGGMGTDNYAWSPEATIFIDYSQGTFRPGDTIRFDVYDRDTGRLISSDTYPHKEESKQEGMMKEFLSHLSV